MRPYKEREINPDKPVYVYRNLADEYNGRGSWSILQNGLVVGHSNRVLMHGWGPEKVGSDQVEFVVRPSGFKRAQTEQRKNVQAFVKGTLMTNWPMFLMKNWVADGQLREFRYDHERGDRFYDVATDTDIVGASLVYLDELGAYYR